MSSLGSSFINKNNKKIVPKAQPRRNRDFVSAQSANPALVPQRDPSQDTQQASSQRPTPSPSPAAAPSDPSATSQSRPSDQANKRSHETVEAPDGDNLAAVEALQPSAKRARLDVSAVPPTVRPGVPTVVARPPTVSTSDTSTAQPPSVSHSRPPQTVSTSTSLPRLSEQHVRREDPPVLAAGEATLQSDPASDVTQDVAVADTEDQDLGRGKRKRTRSSHANNLVEEPERTRKTRKVRSDKGVRRGPRQSQTPAGVKETEDTTGEAPAEEGALPTPSATQSRSSAEEDRGAENIDEAIGAADDDATESIIGQPQRKKKRGRRRRASTPEDGEAETENTGGTTMFELRRDKRTGPISNLEHAMRKIDWDKVKQQKYERDVRDMEDAEARILAREAELQSEDEEAMDEEEQDAEEEDEVVEEGGDEEIIEEGDEEEVIEEGEEEDAQEGPDEDGIVEEDDHLQRPANSRAPRLRMVNGQIVFDNSSLQIDRHAEAEAAVQEYDDAEVAMEESDLTNQFNTRTLIGETKRDPRERFASKHKGDPWSAEETMRWYDAIRMFGTDFMIVSKMFPGKTRGQIKAKWTREERQNPDLVTAALIGEAVPMDVSVFAQATGREESEFKDPAELRAQLEREKEGQRDALEKAARVKAEETERKQTAARERQEAVQKSRDERRRKKDEARHRQRLKARHGMNFVDNSTEEILDSVEGDPGPG